MDELMRTLLQKALPHLTNRRVGRFTDKSPRVVQKWFSGDMEVPTEVFVQVGLQVSALQKSGFAERLHDVITDGLAADLHPELIASHLAAEYKRVTGIEIE